MNSLRLPDSVYDRFGGAQDAESMDKLLSDQELPISIKYTALLAAFARLVFPLQLSDFRALVPGSFWAEHFRFSFSKITSGPYPIYWNADEWLFTVHIGAVAPSAYTSHHFVQMVTERSFIPSGVPYGSFEPPEDLPVHRYTLVHPFLRPELHEPDGIYLV
ncbi:hypothetical protein ACXR0O_25420 [Verrucomicrobiota bacterium sgz303538]